MSNDSYVFVKNISHELKNHFAFESVVAELIQAEVANHHKEYASKLESVINKYCDMLKRHSNKGRVLLETMLSKARGESSSESIKNLKLSPIIHSVIEELASRVHNRLEISVNIPDDYIVYGNEVMLQHIFLNLIENANHAMKADSGKLEIFLSEDQYTICVKDNGQGISPEVLPQIFDQGFTTKATGTGTGLALCKNLMEDMGGSIQCISKLGASTCFKLTFNKRECL